ncbi:MAG TPA: serine/threonine-protein kinase, partial [Planctomycetota bacterium]
MSENTDKPPSKPGTTRTVGKYALVKEVGRGGMGVVYEATDTQVQRKVALKLMLPHPGLLPEQAEQERQRFAREAQMAAKLKHPGIVTLYEAGEVQGRRYLAMEFIEGMPFSSWCQQKGLGLRAKIAVLRDVALAVHHAHEQGVLHRDLKPQNILVTAKNRPVVMDFGLAKAMSADTNLSLTSDGMVVGTPSYMSPEQAKGAKNVDGRTDVYALGVTLYELLAGRKPFEGETAIEILMKASKERAAPPSSARIMAADPAIDRAIEGICLKALERDPKDRYASGRAFATDLTRWLDGEAVHITTVTRRRVRAQRKSRAWIFVSIGAAVVALIAWIVLSPGPAPAGVDAELARARAFLRDKKYSDARVEYGKALAKDPSNTEAREGDRKARAAEEADRASLAKNVEEKQKQLDAARDQSVKDIQNAEQKVKAAASTASDAEQKRLLEELQAIKEKARLAEEEARRAREKLQELSTRPAPAPAPAPAPPPPAPVPVPVPVPVPGPVPVPVPGPRPAPPPKPAPLEPKVALAALKEAVDLAVDKFDIPGIFKAADAFAADAGVDP